MKVIVASLAGFVAATAAQSAIPSPQQDLCELWPVGQWTSDNANWPSNLTNPGDALPPSTGDFICSPASCLGNVGQGQLDGYSGYHSNPESVMVLVQSGARLDVRDSRIWKQGGTTVAPWFNDQGYNAGVDVLDGAILTIRDTSIHTNNGAMNLFARGAGTSVTLVDCKFYSSGFGAWGVVSEAGATTVVQSAVLCNGGINSPAFAGSGLTISYSAAHTWGFGSPIIYATGNVTVTHTTGSANSSAAVIVDGPYLVFLDHCDLAASQLAGVVLYSSGMRSNSFLTMSYGSLAVTASIPCFLVANSISYIALEGVSLIPVSSVIVWADSGIVTSDLTQFTLSNTTAPGQAFVTASRSLLRGYVIVGAGTLISLVLSNQTSWTGGTQYRIATLGAVDVSIDDSSMWFPQPPASVRALFLANNDLGRIGCTGTNISYHATDARNVFLGSRAVAVPGCAVDKQTFLVPRDFQGPVATR